MLTGESHASRLFQQTWRSWWKNQGRVHMVIRGKPEGKDGNGEGRQHGSGSVWEESIVILLNRRTKDTHNTTRRRQTKRPPPPEIPGRVIVSTRVQSEGEETRWDQPASTTTEPRKTQERQIGLLESKVNPMNYIDISYLQEQVYFGAGGIQHCLQEWCTLTSDQEILDTVTGMPIETFGDLPNNATFQYPLGAEEQAFITREIQRLLNKGAIIESTHQLGQVISPICLRPKDDGQYRMIFNLNKIERGNSIHPFQDGLWHQF